MSRFAKVMIALLAVAVFATPALADYKFSVYGSARVGTFYSNFDEANNDRFDIINQGNSRFGMRASNGPVSGHYEVAVPTGGMRLLYGTYKFNGGHFMFGQNYGAFGTQFLGNSVASNDNNGIGWGATYDGRQTVVSVGLDNGLALWAYQNPDQGNNNNARVPRVAVSYKGKVEGFSYSAVAGYQYMNDVKDSYMVGFVGDVDLNPANIKFSVGYAQNGRAMNLQNAAGDATKVGGTHSEAGSAGAGDKVETYMALAEVGFKLNNTNKLVAGGGYVQEKYDGTFDTEKRYTVFVQDQFTIAPGFQVIPEVAYFQVLDARTGVSAAEEKGYFVGAKWQINF